jgi:hypothetical protein
MSNVNIPVIDTPVARARTRKAHARTPTRARAGPRPESTSTPVQLWKGGGVGIFPASIAITRSSLTGEGKDMVK